MCLAAVKVGPEDIRWIMGAIMVAMAALKVLDINAAIRSI
jgi:hypothetical protein